MIYWEKETIEWNDSVFCRRFDYEIGSRIRLPRSNRRIVDYSGSPLNNTRPGPPHPLTLDHPPPHPLIMLDQPPPTSSNTRSAPPHPLTTLDQPPAHPLTTLD